MRVDEVPSAVRRAAEVIGPGLVRGRAEDEPTDLAVAQLLRLGWEPEKGVDPTSTNSSKKSPLSLVTQSTSS